MIKGKTIYKYFLIYNLIGLPVAMGFMTFLFFSTINKDYFWIQFFMAVIFSIVMWTGTFIMTPMIWEELHLPYLK